MGQDIHLTTSDGFQVDAYRVEPAGKSRGGLVVAMEIFGVNRHIRAVADGYAAAGYTVIAPALFDRAERSYDTGYSPEEIQRGVAVMQKLDPAKTLLDVAAAVANVAGAGKVGIVGYCFGGTTAWRSACAVNGLSCAVPYYGGGIPGLTHLSPKVPVLFHWGESDASIPLDKAREFAAKHANQTHHFYAAGHGFNCDHRGSYDAAAANFARQRSLDFLAQHLS
jgi:carboxymethylenebutenolidase